MPDYINNTWIWNKLNVGWREYEYKGNATFAILLIHGFGACKEHWRQNQNIIGKIAPCYSIDLIGFGDSSQPASRLNGEKELNSNFSYSFDNWGSQIADFSKEVIKKPVILVGNSIGGVIALRAAQYLNKDCIGLILINCALRRMDDKRTNTQSELTNLFRPFIKSIIKSRWISKIIFINAANRSFIKQVLKQAYPSRRNINEELINIIYRPTSRSGASEAFHGFINNFNDHIAPDLMKGIKKPVHLIWGEDDPWEPIEEAKEWLSSIQCIRSLKVIKNTGHCPHDENPKEVNKIILNIIQEAIYASTESEH